MASLLARALVLAVIFAAGSASAEEYPECAKITGTLAYNQCLADHGPKAHSGAVTPIGPGDIPREAVGRHEISGPGAGTGGELLIRRHNGRMSVEFDIGRGHGHHSRQSGG
jgi:hypothetical protein